MKITLDIDDDLYRRAQALSGLNEVGVVVREALKTLIERESTRQLAALGGSQPHLRYIRHRRPM